jgi:hypothetical protein
VLNSAIREAQELCMLKPCYPLSASCC